MNRYDHYTDKFIADPNDTQYGILGTNLAEVGTDMVSKQAVLDLWNKYHSYIATKAIEFDSELRALPPAEPQERKGKWIDMGDFEQCSVCTGTRLKAVQTYYGKAIWIRTPYCPNCGCKMEVEHDSV